MKKILLFILIMFVLASPCFSQVKSAGQRDKYTLLTMPYNKRPLTLYRGQIQANAGYQFAVRGRQFDTKGNLVVLKDIGTASVYHYYVMNLKYGITDFLEISAQTNYMKRGIRTQSVTYLSGTDAISVNNLTEAKGFGDLLLLASARLPIQYKWIDFSARGGLFIPTSEFEPGQPQHTITDATSVNTFTLNYHYNNTNGFGVPVLVVSGALKFTVSKFSFETDLTVRDPLKEGDNIRWDETLASNKSFIYSKKTYKYLLNRTTVFNGSINYQAAGWLNIRMNTNYFKSSGGWTEYWGIKYRNPEEKIVTIEPGLEIQISPLVTIYQTAGFPISGKNIDAPFYLFLTLSFNTFPFLR